VEWLDILGIEEFLSLVPAPGSRFIEHGVTQDVDSYPMNTMGML
jgi:hypothetical protein